MFVASAEYVDSLKRLQLSQQNPKLGLAQIRALLKSLGNPERNVSFIHIAGTNGKGSVGAFLDALFKAGDLRSGYFSSPHLACARERIRICSQMVSEQDFCWAEKQVFAVTHRLGLQATYFERILAMSLLLFRRYQVKIAVMEVGIGGLFDATNVLMPKICGITSIGLDHVALLGPTLADIAYQKAGIIKAGVPVISVQQKAEAAEVISLYAKKMAAPLLFVGKQNVLENTYINLRGSHQYENASLAIALLDELKMITSLPVRKAGLGLARWPGRYELFAGDPPVLMDGAHNAHAFEALFLSLSLDDRFKNMPIIAVIGLTNGHQSEEMLAAWQRHKLNIQSIIVTKSTNTRALETQVVFNLLLPLNKQISVIPSACHALRTAMSRAQKIKGLVLVAGSLYLVGELRLNFVNEAQDSVKPIF